MAARADADKRSFRRFDSAANIRQLSTRLGLAIIATSGKGGRRKFDDIVRQGGGKTMLKICTVAIALAGVGAASATADLTVSPPQLQEWVRASVQTGGEDVVGLTTANIRSPLSSSLLSVSGLRQEDRTICVYLERASGLYLARFTMAKPANAETVRFHISSDALLRLDARVGEIAVRAQVSTTDRCSSSAPLLPIGWAAQRSRDIGLLVNRQNAVSISATLNGVIPLKCEDLSSALRLPNMVARSFDTLCHVKAPPCGENATIVVNRRSGLDYWTPVRRVIRGQCE